MGLKATITAAVLFATGITTSLSLAAPAPKPNTLDAIRHPNGARVAYGNCTTTCQRIGQQVICQQHCF
jgi:hypothetical protein